MNSDNKYIQIHSANNIFSFKKKKQQWLLSVVVGHFSLQIQIYYIWSLKSNFPTIHNVKIDSASIIDESLKPK